MNNLLMRRRCLMASHKSPNIAVNAIDNPEFVALMHNAGYCASPKYITVKEAEAFTGPLPSGATNCPHLDLRYFINYTPRICSLGGLKYKITLANKPDPVAVNACLSDAGDGLTVVLPEKVSTIDPWFINDSHITYATVIIEREIPPTILGSRSKLFATDSTDILIFVPDAAVETYKANTFWGQYHVLPMNVYTNQNDFADGYRATNGIITDSTHVMSRRYAITPGQQITYHCPNVTGYGLIELPDNFDYKYVTINDFWTSVPSARTITTKNTTKYIVFNVLKSKMDISYIKNVTTNEYIWKGENV